MAKFNKNDIIQQYLSLLSKLIILNKEIKDREGSSPKEYNSSISKVFAVLILLGYAYEEKGPNIVIRYEKEIFRMEKELIAEFINFESIHEKKQEEIPTPLKTKGPAPVLEEKPTQKVDVAPENKEEPEHESKPKTETPKPELELPLEVNSTPETNLEPGFNKASDQNDIKAFESVSEKVDTLVLKEKEQEEAKTEDTHFGESVSDVEEYSKTKKEDVSDELQMQQTVEETIISEKITEQKSDTSKISDNVEELSNKDDAEKQDITEVPISNEITNSENVSEDSIPEDIPENEQNILNKIFEADSSVIFIPGIRKEAQTWLDNVLQNLAKDNYDYKPHENFIYNRHIMRLKTDDGIEKVVKFIIYPMEYQNNKIPTSILVISDYYGRIKCAFSEKRKIVEITIDDMDFMVSGKWLDGEFNSLISPTENVKGDSIVSDINRVFTKGVYPKHFGKRIKIGNSKIDVFPVNNQNNKYGVVASVALVKENQEIRPFISGDDGRLMIPTHGKLNSYDTYWMGDGFHVTES